MSPSITRDSSQSRDDSDIEKATVRDPAPTTLLSSLARHLKEDINPRGVDIVILLCWFTTGFLDSTIFNAYRTFVSMQTGNTIFIGLGASNNTQSTRPYGWLKSLSSLITFLLGCFFFSRLASYMGPHRRLTFLLSFTIQTSLLLLAAILVQTSLIESRLEYLIDDIDFLHLIPIILLSFQAPGQTCMARQVDMPEVPTVVVTTMIYDFASDGGVFWGVGGRLGGVKDGRWHLGANPKRNRRFAGFVCMLVGAIAGGWVTVWTRHIAASLWVAAGVKGVMTGAWVGWPAKRMESED